MTHEEIRNSHDILLLNAQITSYCILMSKERQMVYTIYIFFLIFYF